MSKEVASKLVVMRISTTSVADALSAGKVIVCEEDSAWSSTSDVSQRPTKCGTFQTTNSPVHKITGSGVAVGDLAAGELSSQQLKIYLDGQTNLFFAYKNATDGGTILDGEVVYLTGQGYFSSVNTTSNSGDGMTTFDWEFTPSGAVDLVP